MLKRILTHHAIRGSTLTVLDQAIVSISNFLTGVLVARAVAAEDFGVYSLLFIALGMLGGVQNALITGPLKVIGVRAQGVHAAEYFAAQLYLQLLLSAVLALGAALVFLLSTSVDVETVLAFAVCLLLFQLQELARITNLTKFSLGNLLLLDSFTHGFRLGLLVLLSIQGMLTSTSVFWAIALSCAIGTTMYGRRQYVSSSPALPLNKVAAENWGYGRWVLLETIAYTASTQAYFYFTALWVDARTAGALNAVVSLLNIVNVLQVGLMSFAIPKARQKLIEYGYDVWKRWLLRVGFVVTGLTALMVLVVAIFAEPLLSSLYTPFFAGYAFLVPILAFSYILTALNTTLSAVFLTARLPQVGLVGKAISAALTLSFAYPIIQLWGVKGAAFGLLATSAVWLIVYLFYIFNGAVRPGIVTASIEVFSPAEK